MFTTTSIGVGERSHCPRSAMEGLGVHRITNTQKVHNGQDGGLVLITSARDAPCLINDMWTGMTRDVTVYPVFRRLLPGIYSYLLTLNTSSEPPPFVRTWRRSQVWRTTCEPQSLAHGMPIFHNTHRPSA